MEYFFLLVWDTQVKPRDCLKAPNLNLGSKVLKKWDVQIIYKRGELKPKMKKCTCCILHYTSTFFYKESFNSATQRQKLKPLFCSNDKTRH